MPTNTHTTATVRLQLDLTGLISQLRELADTLEATQQPKTAPAADDPEPAACENCNATWAECDEKLAVKGRACCKSCKVYDTHKAQDGRQRPTPPTTPLAAALQSKAGQTTNVDQ